MELKEIASQWISEPIFKISEIDNGLINHTFIVETQNEKYILQRINSDIFKNPDSIVLNHLRINEVLEHSDYSKKTVQLLPLKNDDFLLKDKSKQSWRMMNFIENSITFLKVPDAETAFEAAQCFSEFYSILNAKPLELKDVLPDFINFEKRISDYKIALQNASEEKKKKAKSEIDFINENISLPEKWIQLQKENRLPKRIIHADPKISNVLFNKENKAVAVIDLDTMMTSTLLYDFGDMMRSYCNLTKEDDANLEDNFSPKIYDAVKKGFLSHLENILTQTEIENLDYAAKVVIFIQAVRFLTDYLNNDVYYSTNYELHNLDRTKNQLNLFLGLNKTSFFRN